MSIARLAERIHTHKRLVVLTGAGVSADSGIPTYRNDHGDWLRSEPIQHQAFVNHPLARQRYWSRSLVGWPYFARAQPNDVHYQLASLELAGYISLLVTQNVDRLHQRAGHKNVIDLHGRLDRVRCLDCHADFARQFIQEQLLGCNPDFQTTTQVLQPDGDADIAYAPAAAFNVPNCPQCDGLLMPAVVFFGGSVDRQCVEEINIALDNAGGLLVIGSSLSTYSGYRFCRRAVEKGKSLYIINRGRTRADELADIKLVADCGSVITQLLEELNIMHDTADFSSETN